MEDGRLRAAALRRGALLLLIVGVVGWLLIIASKPSKPNLLDRATRVGSTQGWPPSVGGALNWEPACVWLSDHEVLHFIGGPKGGATAALLDTRTGIDSPLPALNALSRGRVLDASPGGQWIMWTRNARPRPGTSATGLAVASRANSDAVSLPPSCGFGAWLPDGRRWAAVITDDQPYASRQGGSARQPDRLVIYGLDDPRGRGVTLPAIFGPLWIIGSPAPSHALLSSRPVGLSWQVNPSEGPSRALNCLDVDFASPTPAVRPFRVPLPDQPGAQDVILEPSPTGDRLLWCDMSDHQGEQSAWLTRVAQALHLQAPPGRALDLWVSGNDGSDPRKIGHLDIGSKDHPPTAFRWTLDGRRLSFVYHNTLWTVPAD